MQIRLQILLLLLIICFQINAQTDTTRLFVFGNSTINHEFQTIPTPSNETAVPHWVYLLAEHENRNFAAGGVYGFLPWFATLEFFSQWGFDIVPGVWESDTETFAEADITTVLITGANFIQWQAPYLPYPNEGGVTPLSATETLTDWVSQQEDSIKIYIYENWPDMAGYLGNGFPPTAQEFEDYNDYTQNGFHDWWLEYHDSLLVAQSDNNIRMIPVGNVLSKLFTETVLDQLPITEIYEDDAPHGRATLYFLAGLITYMAIYETEAPADYSVPSIIHPIVQNNYTTVVSFIWSELQNFTDANGDNRVFCPTNTSVANVVLTNDCISLYPNPTNNVFEIEGLLGDYNIEILDASGAVYQSLNTTNSSIEIDITSLPMGLYFISMVNVNNGALSMQKILKGN